jgi:hypothetical protein
MSTQKGASMHSNDFDTLTAQVRIRTMQLVSRLGTYGAAAEARVARDTLARACGGLPLRRGTVFALAHHFGLLPTPMAISSLPDVAA